MKGGGGGLLCRSHSATAVCLPQDPRVMVLPSQRRRGSVDFEYSRLGAGEPAGLRRSSGDRRPVTLSMLTEKEIPLPNPAPAATDDDLVFQVVVMRVSLHCKGCEGKVRKHISKMEGVTSFSIDLESKRVTVMGHVSPMGVLESISKVKKAEFWPCS